MKNLKYIMATLMVALIVAIVCVACNKDKETPVQEANNNSENEPNTEVVERKPFATRNLKTGEVTYTYDLEEYQVLFDEIMGVKDEDSPYIVESIEIIDELSKSEISDLALMCSIIDCNKECSYVSWLSKDFFDIINDENNSYYYYKEEVLDGEFEFLNYSKTGTYLISVEGNHYTAELWNEISKSNKPPKQRQVSCDKEDCQLRTCEPHDFGEDGWGCDDCVPSGPNTHCITHIAPDDFWWRVIKLVFGGGLPPVVIK